MPVSRHTPSRLGPRHWGQSSARTTADNNNGRARAAARPVLREPSICNLLRRAYFGTVLINPRVAQALPKYVIGTGLVIGFSPGWAREVMGQEPSSFWP